MDSDDENLTDRSEASSTNIEPSWESSSEDEENSALAALLLIVQNEMNEAKAKFQKLKRHKD